MPYITISEISPVSDLGREDCPMNCTECRFFNGIVEDGRGGYDVECELEEE